MKIKQKLIKMKLYLKDYKKKSTTCVKSFLLDYYKNVFSLEGTPATYFSPICDEKDLQCSARKSRSFTDMYYLTKTYFPTLTEKTFTKKLVEVMKVHKLKFLFCNGAKKTVIHASFGTNNQRTSNFFKSLVFDYCGLLKTQYNLKGNGEHSIIDVIEFSGYKNDVIEKELNRLRNT